MYNRIMVPLDGSELAEVTLWYAARLAGRLHASLTLVYVSTPDEITSPHMHECYLKDVATRVKADADKIASSKEDGDVTVDYKMLKGDPAEEIINYAERAKIELIILSTQGKSGVKRWPLGNVANKVVSSTGKQVLLIRAKGAKPEVYKGSLEKVLVPVDGSRESESILKYVSYLAAELGLEITLLHIFVREMTTYFTKEILEKGHKERILATNYLERLGRRLKDKGLNVKTVLQSLIQYTEAEEIIRQAEKGKFSMVAMATHGRSGVGRWIFGSNAQKVLNEGSTPLLLVRPPKSRKKS